MRCLGRVSLLRIYEALSDFANMLHEFQHWFNQLVSRSVDFQMGVVKGWIVGGGVAQGWARSGLLLAIPIVAAATRLMTTTASKATLKRCLEALCKGSFILLNPEIY